MLVTLKARSTFLETCKAYPDFVCREDMHRKDGIKIGKERRRDSKDPMVIMETLQDKNRLDVQGFYIHNTSLTRDSYS
jgi:hypothetical protein